VGEPGGVNPWAEVGVAFLIGLALVAFWGTLAFAPKWAWLPGSIFFTVVIMVMFA
jgi:hypothetical protein